MSTKYKKLLILNLPYVIVGLLATNVGEIWRMAVGENDIVNIGLHFFHKDVRPMQLPVKKYSTVVA